MIIRLLKIVLVVTPYWIFHPASAFSPANLNSVVIVLPVWPDYRNNDVERSRVLEEPEGTAVAIKPGGYLVTNFHVIRRALSISVRLTDGRLLTAEVVGVDPLTDLALIKVPEDITVLPIGQEPTLAAPACAIGNQFGLGLSVTCGVVSATHRTGTGFNKIEDFIQTDATVNPGASGGALVNDQNQLIGVLSAIFTKKTDANLGINFAASTRLVLRVVEDLISYKKVIRGRVGMRVKGVPAENRRYKFGAIIRTIISGGSAEAAGLRVNDIITKIGERLIKTPSDVTSEINMYRIGEKVNMTIRRGDHTLNIMFQISA